MKIDLSYICPTCGKQGNAGHFSKLKERDSLKWNSMPSEFYITRCPSCNARLKFTNKALAFVMLMAFTITVVKLAQAFLGPFEFIAIILFLPCVLIIFKKLVKLEIQDNA